MKPTLKGGAGSPAASASIMADAYACKHYRYFTPVLLLGSEAGVRRSEEGLRRGGGGGGGGGRGGGGGGGADVEESGEDQRDQEV